ncbi:TadG family pilus assembly protein [Chromohalobacter canadensis]|uniref:TadG family pilus assembly protein n=1 Tax=Chromohalobacter canadensis TaxID=141389 RepID=UPI00240F9E9F|nr:TadG family pilus assembly protein [Chromohalobacter canadensis]
MMRNASPVSCGTQRGAIGLLAMGVLGLVILCLVLALDVGRLYYEKAKLQKQADTAAMEAAAALAKPPDEGDDASLTMLQRGTVGINEKGVNVFTASDEASSDAVRVTVSETVPTSLIANIERLFSNSEVEETSTLSASAVARRTPVAAMALGTQLLSVDGDKALLEPVLSALGAKNLDLDLVGYEGLAQTQVTLLELARELPGVGVDLSAASIDEVLNATVTVSELAQASLNILRSGGNDDALVGMQSVNGAIGLRDVISALNNFTGGLSGNARDVSVPLGDLLAVDLESPQRESALFAGIGVGNLLSGALLAANQQSGIHIDNLDANIGELAVLTFDLNIIEPPQIAVGPVGCEAYAGSECNEWRSEAKTAQLELDLETAVDVIGLVRLDVGLDLDAASARGGIEFVVPQGDQQYDVGVGARSALLTSTFDVELSLLKFADLLTLRLEQNQENQTVASGDPPNDTLEAWPTNTTLRFGEGIGGVSGLLGPLLAKSNIELSLLDDGDEQCSGLLGCLGQGIEDLVNETLGSVGDLLSALTVGLDDVLDTVLAPLIDPLLNGLGLSLNGVDAEVLGVGYGKVELIRVGDPDA